MSACVSVCVCVCVPNRAVLSHFKSDKLSFKNNVLLGPDVIMSQILQTETDGGGGGGGEGEGEGRGGGVGGV